MAGFLKGLLVGLGSGLLLFLLIADGERALPEAQSPAIVAEAAPPNQGSGDSPPLQPEPDQQEPAEAVENSAEALPEDEIPPKPVVPDDSAQAPAVLGHAAPKPVTVVIEKPVRIQGATQTRDKNASPKLETPATITEDTSSADMGFVAPDLSMPPDANRLLNTQE